MREKFGYNLYMHVSAARWLSPMENNAYSIVGPRRKIRLRREDNLDDALTEIQFSVEKVA